MKYNWKKGLATAGMIFLGELLAHFHGVSSTPLTWAYWKDVLVHAGELTAFTEARYIYTWLASINGGTTQ